MTAALTLRRATFADAPFLLAIRNADDVRSQSKAQEVIPEEIHESWLQKNLNSSDAVIWVIEREGERLGYVRVLKIDGDHEKRNWLLSIALERSARGQRYASWALREACRLMRKDVDAGSLVAEVLAANAAARHLFKNAGFVDKTSPADNRSQFVRFELPLS
jgi:RimJ/RimL family protein N-acetyltransferase